MSGLLILGLLVLTGNAAALEAAAGADTVDTSQVGISAKLDAVNAVTTATINNILGCEKQGKVYSSISNSCISLAETDPVASPKITSIFTCGNANKIAHSDGSCSSAVPPDVSSQVSNIIACNAQGKLFNGSGCAALPGGSTPHVVGAGSMTVQTNGDNQTRSAAITGNAQFCVVSNDGRYGKGRGNCTVSGTPGGAWTVTVTSQDSTNNSAPAPVIIFSR